MFKLFRDSEITGPRELTEIEFDYVAGGGGLPIVGGLLGGGSIASTTTGTANS